MFDQFFSSQGKVLYEMMRYILPVMRQRDDQEFKDISPPQDLNSDKS